MSAEVFRVNDKNNEVALRSLRKGQLIRGYGRFPLEGVVFVELAALSEGKGITLRRRDPIHRITDMSVTYPYIPEKPPYDAPYVLICKMSGKKAVTFHVYPH